MNWNFIRQHKSLIFYISQKRGGYIGQISALNGEPKRTKKSIHCYSWKWHFASTTAVIKSTARMFHPPFLVFSFLLFLCTGAVSILPKRHSRPQKKKTESHSIRLLLHVCDSPDTNAMIWPSVEVYRLRRRWEQRREECEDERPENCQSAGLGWGGGRGIGGLSRGATLIFFRSRCFWILTGTILESLGLPTR